MRPERDVLQSQIADDLKADASVSDRELGRRYGVDGKVAGRVRAALETAGTIAPRQTAADRRAALRSVPLSDVERSGLWDTIVAKGLAGDVRCALWALQNSDVPIAHPAEPEEEVTPSPPTDIAAKLEARKAENRRRRENQGRAS